MTSTSVTGHSITPETSGTNNLPYRTNWFQRLLSFFESLYFLAYDIWTGQTHTHTRLMALCLGLPG